MITKTVSIIVIVLLVIGGLIYFFSSSSQNQYINNYTPATSTDTSNSTTTVATTITPIKLIDEPYYKSAYEIDPTKLNNLSAILKQVLTGFNVTSKNNYDGTVTISFTSTNPEYINQSYNLKAGQKLYFIENNPSDDVGGKDNFLQDDTAVIVDVNGNVVQ